MTIEQRADHAAKMVVNILLTKAETQYEKSAIKASHEDWYDYFEDLLNDTMDPEEYKIV